MMTSLLWRHLTIEHSRSVYYFSHQHTNDRKAKKTQHVNVTSVNVMTPVFYFSTYRSSSFKHLSHLSTRFWLPDAKIDAGCYPSHCRTTDCTSIGIWYEFLPHGIFFHRRKKMIITGAKSGLYGRYGNTCLTPAVPQSPKLDLQCKLAKLMEKIHLWGLWTWESEKRGQ